MSTRITCLFLVALLVPGIGCRRPPVPATTEISSSQGSNSAEADRLQLDSEDWPQWRGPQADGVAIGPAVPTRWSDSENVVWKVKVPGHGHSSPIIVGPHIYLATADDREQVQSVLCLDRADGHQVWTENLHRGQFETAMHRENSQATSTPACDGEKLIVLFLNDRKIWATALDLKGQQLWQTEVGNFASKFGYSASPTLYKSLVLIAADHAGGGFIAALDRQDGSIVWRKGRPAKSSYASPRVVSLGGRDQLVLAGCNLVASYNPLTGEQLWSTSGSAEAAVGTLVVADDMVLASGGYPEQETLAVSSAGKEIWRHKVKSYVPSLLTHQGYLYFVNDDGIARCYDAQTGVEKWKHRIGGNFRVSPVLSGDKIFVTDMEGKSTVFEASPDQFRLVASNQLGTEAFASPGISRGQIFLRVATSSIGTRQEWLYCIGTKETTQDSAPE